MLSKERRFRIMNLLNEKTFVMIGELTKELKASRSSINRDLIALEKQGLLQREHGGATLKDAINMVSQLNEKPVFDKENINAKAKRAICDCAALNVKDGDCIYIDSGTTPAYLLTYLMQKKIQIVTSSIYLLRKLPATFQGDIYLLGGAFERKYDMSLGSITLEVIQQFNFDYAFLSANGANLENSEVYIFDFAIGAVKKEIMKRSQKNYLLIDDSKFNIKAVCSWASLQDFTKVYVNAIPKQEKYPENFIICKAV